jgi:phage baseplate assembly protein W
MKRENANFLGRGWAFPPSFDLASGQVEMVEGNEDIQQSLRILFSTLPGERIMVPDYGCDLRAFVFESIDETTLTHMKTIISDAILFFEPRIILDDVVFDTSAIDDGVLNISMDYTVETTNSRSNFVFPYYLTEATLTQLS